MNFIGYSLQCPEDQVDVLDEIFPEVKFYEPVVRMEAASGIVNTIPFHPQFLRDESPSVSKNGFCTMTYETYNDFLQDNYYDPSYDDFRVYILDTGIQASHECFEGRVEFGFDAVTTTPLMTDPHGHGTQVAGAVAGLGYGVSPSSHLVDVRVLAADGTGRSDDVLAGLDYVLGRHLKAMETHGPLNALACMSLTGPRSRALKHALYAISKALLVVGAVGDHDSFSCSYSPAESPYAIIAAATARGSDLELQGSNFGDCIDINAPGEFISTPFIGESNRIQSTLTGSSASAAIVTGIAANLYAVLRSNRTLAKHSTVYEFIKSQVPETEASLFVRNILLSSRVSIGKSLAKEAHMNSFNECDLRNTKTFVKAAVDHSKKLMALADRPQAFQKVKKNLAAHQKKKAEALYE
eukprot:CAMPEP_0185041760 /NCGR_PEP_ID=MMETSP1103-20130426/41456_1 /TAXON_ID=36769 /ORGANISM="Paraphysomonas bandaiensis, Strain Caron Lab Isolate" /LENGTH=409 /DNA_ID=CAMNT_0027581631 /DNA_START=89 /DNA_END=1318 /DNA_ORIENTATION=+